MILRQSYRDDVIEQLRELEDDKFPYIPKATILSDSDMLEMLWYIYQKNIEDYDMEPRDACIDALSGFRPIS